MTSKRAEFSDDENRVLREALRRLRDERGLSQAAVGRLVGITQQNAARLLSAQPYGGMGRRTANALARELGFRDVEHMLLEAGVLASMKEIPSGSVWVVRDTAVRVGRSMGIPEEAIQAVIARHTDSSAYTRPMWWWTTNFGNEAREQAADRVQAILDEQQQRRGADGRDQPRKTKRGA